MALSLPVIDEIPLKVTLIFASFKKINKKNFFFFFFDYFFKKKKFFFDKKKLH